MTLLANQSGFIALLDLLDKRNELHLRYQEKLAAIERGQYLQFRSEAEFERAVGNDLVGQLKSLTAAVQKKAGDSIEDAKSDFESLRAALKERYPDDRFHNVENWPHEYRGFGEADD